MVSFACGKNVIYSKSIQFPGGRIGKSLPCAYRARRNSVHSSEIVFITVKLKFKTYRRKVNCLFI